MHNLIKKDFLTISRDRSELLILLVMPLVLTAILSMALGGIMSGTTGINEMQVAVVIENDFASDIALFEQALNQRNYPPFAVQAILTGAKAMDPAAILLNILASPEFEGLIKLETDYDQTQAEQALSVDQVMAVITLPQRFSYDTLMAYFLGTEPQAKIGLLVQDHQQIRAGIIENILTSFTDQFNMQLAIYQATQGEQVEATFSEDDFGEITYISTHEPVSSFQYYTIGMAVMFALYVASTVSSNAFKEKTSHAFARLMLSGERPLRYLLSKGLLGTVLASVQLGVLFGVSAVFYQTFSGLSLETILAMVLVTLTYVIIIGSLAMLLTAIALQFNDDAVSGIFTGFVVSGLAFLGGSMVPVEQFSQLLRTLGNWTPNGAIMTAYLQLFQGLQFNDILPLMLRVMMMTVVIGAAAVAIFPQRRLM